MEFNFQLKELFSQVPHFDKMCKIAFLLNIPLSKEICGVKSFTAAQINLDIYASNAYGIGFRFIADFSKYGKGSASIEQTKKEGWKICGTVGSTQNCITGCLTDSNCASGRCENNKCVECWATAPEAGDDDKMCNLNGNTGECYDGVCYPANKVFIISFYL